MKNFSQARKNMVDSQLRPNGITDSRILLAMGEVAREQFVAPDRAEFAYMDEDVAMSHRSSSGGAGRMLMEPMILARLLQLAEVRAGERVLDVGSGTGYSSAILAKMGAKVTAFEADAGLAERARAWFAANSELGVELIQGDLAKGPVGNQTYDLIFVNGQLPELHQAFAALLAENGRMIAVEGRGPMGRAVVTQKLHGALGRRVVFDASVPLLPGFIPERVEFSF